MLLMNILAIETSCDETACAVVKDGTTIISNVVATSAEMHQKYGGIVPEVAARKQLESILPVIMEAISPLKTGSDLKMKKGQTPLLSILRENIDAIAVSVGPGLIGSLLIGVETAKTIAFATDLPIIPVNHVLAHMFANFIQSDKEKVTSDKQKHKTIHQFNNGTIEFPAISLVVSGGHTELYLMKSEKELTWLGGTLDDAAGECFDKTARLLGFGSSGGVAIQEAAKKCKVQSVKCKIKLPRPMMHDQSFNFSFSGLKTAVVREWKKQKKQTKKYINALAYEIQESITDVLVTKTLRAAHQYEAKSILLSGGVAANLRLRKKFISKLETRNSKLSFHVPPVELCTDNAAYIGSYAYFYGKPANWHDITAIPDLSAEVTT